MLDFCTVTLPLYHNPLVNTLWFGFHEKKKTLRFQVYSFLTVPRGSVLNLGSIGAPTWRFVASMRVVPGASKNNQILLQ